MSQKLKAYYWLTKPGIVYGNTFVAAGTFLFASQGDLNISNFLFMLIGIAMVIGSACVFNNYFDRELDAKMTRTKSRALASKTIAVSSALVFGSILGLVGIVVLFVGVNALTATVGLLAFSIYVLAYTPLKPRSVHATLVGSLAGAMPPVGGYVAATNHIDQVAIILFLILVFWQMPHFYAIALYRLKEYKAAKVPVLPLVYGTFWTQVIIIIYILGFLIASQALALQQYVSLTYSLAILAVTLFWLSLAFRGLKSKTVVKWAKTVFHFSLIVLVVFTLLLSVDYWLP